MLARSASIRAFTRRDGVRLVAIGVLIIVAAGAILAVDALPGRSTAPAPSSMALPRPIFAPPRAPTYTSDAATEQRREEARQQVPPQYDFTNERGRVTADQQLGAFEEAVEPVDAAYAAVLDDLSRQTALRRLFPS